MRIVYFDVDCLRPDHLGCYGYDRPTSPAIDRIAADGVRFDNYYCASSPCLPSRTAWASGRFGIRNGVISNHGAGARFRIRNHDYGGPHADNEMLMRRLRAHGYDTISFSNFADRHSALWFMCGWSEFHTPNLKFGEETADEVNEPLFRWLDQNARRDDYFLHINYWDAHRCYKVDPSWADRFRDHPVRQPWPDDDAIRRHGETVSGPFTARGQFPDRRSPFPLMPDAIADRGDFERMITGYDAAIAYVDDRISRVLDELDRHGVLDDAVIIVSGDHGDAFGEHGIYSDHVCADECIHRIPLVVRWPGVATAGARSRELLYNVDFAPTLCDLLGIPAPTQWDGSSFRGTLGGGDGPTREFLVWDCGLYTVQRAVRTRTHLMIRTWDAHGYPFAPVELYDISADPFQARDLARSEPGIIGECSALMDDWVQARMRATDWHGDPLSEILRERAAGA